LFYPGDEMTNCLKLVVIDSDLDYFEIEIFASSVRFSGATRIFTGCGGLTDFADAIAGFPTNPADQRSYLFGSYTGPYCGLTFFCRDRTGHAEVFVVLEDDSVYHSKGFAKFTIPVMPSDIDKFVARLRQVQEDGYGEARLPSDS
jgi:hypothetical protein